MFVRVCSTGAYAHQKAATWAIGEIAKIIKAPAASTTVLAPAVYQACLTGSNPGRFIIVRLDMIYTSLLYLAVCLTPHIIG